MIRFKNSFLPWQLHPNTESASFLVSSVHFITVWLLFLLQTHQLMMFVKYPECLKRLLSAQTHWNTYLNKLCVFSIWHKMDWNMWLWSFRSAPVWHYELCGGAEMEGSDQSGVPPSRHKLLSCASVHVASPPLTPPPRSPTPSSGLHSVISNQQMGRGLFFSFFTFSADFKLFGCIKWNTWKSIWSFCCSFLSLS